MKKGLLKERNNQDRTVIDDSVWSSGYIQDEEERMNKKRKERKRERKKAGEENDDGRKGEERKERFSRRIGNFKYIKIETKEWP